MSRSFSSFKSVPELIFYTRKYCGLCEIAHEVILDVQKLHSFKLLEIDIDKQENLRKYLKYTYDVPIAFIGDKEVFRHRVDRNEFLKILKDLH